MKFALITHLPWPEDTDARGVVEQTTEDIILGEELGFYSAWLAEHHFTRYGIGSSALVFASAIAARTSRIRLGTAVLVPPLHNPIRLAEDTATLDLISNGRLDVGFGRGASRSEFTPYGVDHSDTQASFQESVNMIRGNVDYAGVHARRATITAFIRRTSCRRRCSSRTRPSMSLQRARRRRWSSL